MKHSHTYKTRLSISAKQPRHDDDLSKVKAGRRRTKNRISRHLAKRSTARKVQESAA